MKAIDEACRVRQKTGSEQSPPSPGGQVSPAQEPRHRVDRSVKVVTRTGVSETDAPMDRGRGNLARGQRHDGKFRAHGAAEPNERRHVRTLTLCGS